MQKEVIVNTTYTGNVTVFVSVVASGPAISRTAIIEGVEIDFCSGNRAGNNLIASASLLATMTLKSFFKKRERRLLLIKLR